MYHIIVNPIAGKKKALKSLKIVKKVFDEKGVKYTVHKSMKQGGAREIAAGLTQGKEITQCALDAEQLSVGLMEPKSELAFVDDEKRKKIVVIGGDGTLHEVLNGLADPTACEIGIIPAGTGNDFAEAAGIPTDIKKAALMVLSTMPKATDYLEIGGVRCMNVGGMGMDVDVLVRYNKKKSRKKINYYTSLLHSIKHFKGFKITIENEGVKEERDAYIAVACNGSQIGGGIRICPGAVIDDGKIEVNIVSPMSGMKLLKTLVKLMKGTILTSPYSNHFLCDRIHITTAEKPFYIQLDGEIYENIDFDVQIKKGLRIYRY